MEGTPSGSADLLGVTTVGKNVREGMRLKDKNKRVHTLLGGGHAAEIPEGVEGISVRGQRGSYSVKG